MIIIINQLWSNCPAKPTPSVWLIDQSKLRCKSREFGFLFLLVHRTSDLGQVKLLCSSPHCGLELWALEHCVILGTMFSSVVWQDLLPQSWTQWPAYRCSLPFPSWSHRFSFLSWSASKITWCLQSTGSPRLTSVVAHEPVASYFSEIPCSPPTCLVGFTK